MKTPPGLIAAALLFWGWETGIVVPAVLMALVLEIGAWVRWRFDFSFKDLCRLWEACLVLSVGAVFYCVMTRDSTNDLMVLFTTTSLSTKPSAQSQLIDSPFALIIFVEWLPMVLFPMALAQAYGNYPKMPLEVFSWYARRNQRRSGRSSPWSINIAFPYFALVLLGATVTNRREEWFYPIFCVLIAWALWVVRPRRVTSVVWLAVLLLVGKVGFWGHKGIIAFSNIMEGKVAEMVNQWVRHQPNDRENQTSIGKIGRMKLSGKILLRVTSDGPPPPLLREASYSLFSNSRWFIPSDSRQLADVPPDTEITRWPLMTNKVAARTVRVAQYVYNQNAVLPLPSGTALIDHLPMGQVLTNSMGLTKATNGPSFIEFQAHYGPGATIDCPPVYYDKEVPKQEELTVKHIVQSLQLRNKSLPEKLRLLQNYFTANFQYTTYLTIKNGNEKDDSPIVQFLTKTHAGHCEYFATATVLLLRQAGIPARYATGFSVQEDDSHGHYIVRERHGHAWAIYYDAEKKTWIDFDTTPGSWFAEEAKEASIFEPFRDFGSSLWFRFSRWRWLGERGQFQNYLLGVLLVLIAFLVWRVFFKQKRIKQPGKGKLDGSGVLFPGMDSEFYAVEQRLHDLGAIRLPGESLLEWLRRLEATPQLSSPVLRELARLHYRLRFDPHGLPMEERATLRTKVTEWLRTKAAARS